MRSNKNKSTKQELVQVSLRINPFNEKEKELEPISPKNLYQKNSFLMNQELKV